MAICPPNTAINRILAALGLENVRSLKINAAVNDVVTVVTEQYVTGTQMDDLAAALETKEWVLVPKDAGRWIAVSERLPEEYETVLVATDGSVSAGEIRFPDGECGMDEPWWMVFKDKRDRSAAWAGLVALNDVTHWMPLPEPPTQ